MIANSDLISRHDLDREYGISLLGWIIGLLDHWVIRSLDYWNILNGICHMSYVVWHGMVHSDCNGRNETVQCGLRGGVVG